MSRSRAVAFLMESRRAIRADLPGKTSAGAPHAETRLREVEQLLLNVRAGRIGEFDLEVPIRLHVIVSD